MESKLLELTDDNFEEEVVKSPIPVMVDFYADWCAPCRAIAPVLESLSGEMEGNIKIVKANVEKTTLTQKYDIANIPAFLVFKEGKVVGRKVGLIDKKSLVALASGNDNNG